MTLIVGLTLGLGLLLAASPLLWPGGRERAPQRGWVARFRDRMAGAGLASVSFPLFVAVSAIIGLAVAGVAFALLPAVALAAASGVAAAFVPALVVNWRAATRRRATRGVWPDVVDHVLAGIRAGQSLPDSVAALALTGPPSTREPFAQFEREWSSTGSFARSLDSLKDRLADPSADRILETLRMSREVGGTELPAVLRSLSTYLREDAAVRGEVEARQSWVKNAAKLGAAAPWVVLAMLSTRPEAAAAYNSTAGVVLIAVGLVVTVVAYRLMVSLARLPDEGRWFA